MSEVAHEGERPADLTMALETLMRFGTLMLRAGDTAFRVRDWMSMIARGMGLDALSVNIALGGMTVTARRGGEHATLVSEIAPPGVNAWRLGALEHLARNTQPGMTPQELAAKLAKIEAEPPLYPLAVTVAAVGAASGAFCYLSGGNMLEVVAAITGSSVGQWLRSLLVRRRFNQYAVTALCAMVASGVYCLIAAVWTGAGFALPRHAPGFISSVLFLFPGFPLVAGLNDLLQHQTVAGMSRLTYGAMVVMSAAFGLGIVASAVGLTTAPPPPHVGEILTLLLRAIASFAGGCGFAILYNCTPRTVLALGGFALVGNELRLALHDAGMDLASATFLGALSVGLMASLARRRMQQSRIVLTVPGIIIMVPGIYGFQTIVLLNQGDMLAAMQAAALGGFIVGAMSLGLTASRFITERRWLIES
jgi:uncharacterized membrane protein YjjP (DUF1212 family)/uncharacterized membrane protein YjjB (DUF3815 family)